MSLNDNLIPTLDTSKIPNLDSNKITSGTLDSGRIPNLSADKTTSGTFDAGRIPNLDASKITSGRFDYLRMPFIQSIVDGRSYTFSRDYVIIWPMYDCGSGYLRAYDSSNTKIWEVKITNLTWFRRVSWGVYLHTANGDRWTNPYAPTIKLEVGADNYITFEL